MKNRNTIKIILFSILLALETVILILSIIAMVTKKDKPGANAAIAAFAENAVVDSRDNSINIEPMSAVSPAYYALYNTYNYKAIRPQNDTYASNTSDTIYYSSTNVARLYMYPSSYSGTGTLEQGKTLNWNYVNIYAEVLYPVTVSGSQTNYYFHRSFVLNKDGAQYYSHTYSSATDRTSTMLFSGELTDGNYSFTYLSSFAYNSAITLVEYTYNFTFTIHRTLPTYTVKAGTDIVTGNNIYTNKAITYTAADPLLYGVYVQYAGSSSYIFYAASNTSYAAVIPDTQPNGWYYFYAEDTPGNICQTVAVYLDTAPPVGTLYANGTAVTSGKYTNKPFYYAASDAGVGINYLQYKIGASGTWTTYAGANISTNNGWYYFRAVDKFGYVSTESNIYYETTAPTCKIFSNTGAEIANGANTNGSYITFTATDNESGVSACYVKPPNASSFSAYTQGTQLTAEGLYSFYAVDVAGNQSATVTVRIDRTAPVGQLYSVNTAVTSGTYTNAASIKYTATDDGSGIAGLYVMLPNSSSYSSYTSGANMTAEGVYSFYTRDSAGNQSATVNTTLDRTAPSSQLYAGTSTISSGSFTNAEYVKFTAMDTLSGVKTCYVKLPNAGSFTAYTPDTPLSLQGQYSFYSVDNAANESAVVTIYLDKTNPTGSISTDKTETNGAYTNQAFKYTAADGESGIDHCQIKRPNGAWETYVSGTTILSSGVSGLYTFRSFDKGGNISTESIIYLDTNAPATKLFAATNEAADGTFTNAGYVKFTATDGLSGVKAYYIKLPGGSGFIAYTPDSQLTAQGQYSFYAVDNAGNESAIVTIYLDMTIPTGLVSTDKIEVNGAYTNKSFKYTANDSGSGIGYCQILKPNGTWEAYTSGAIVPASGANGLYTFRCYDKAGNMSAESLIYLDTVKPEVKIFGGDKEITNGSTTNAGYVKFTAADGLSGIDSCFVLILGAQDYTQYTMGAPLSAQGKYSFYAEDAAGNRSETVTAYLFNVRPTGFISTDITEPDDAYTNKSFYYTATDYGSGIDYCQIKRPNGTWEYYTIGTTIPNTDTNGLYAFRCYDKAGNVSAESAIYLDTVKPEVKVFGGDNEIINGSITNANYVKFTAADSLSGIDSCFVLIPGAQEYTQYTMGAPLSIQGKYFFYAEDVAGNRSGIVAAYLYNVKPTGFISTDITEPDGAYINKSFYYTATDYGSGIDYCQIKRPNGVWENYVSGTVMQSSSANGLYIFRCYDKAGNVSDESTIYLDTMPPSVKLFADETEVTSSVITNASYVKFATTDSLSGVKTCYVKLPNAGNFTIYTPDTPLTLQGQYSFYSADNAGNESAVVTVYLDKTNPTGSISTDKAEQNGAYTNQAFKYTAADGESGIDYCQLKRPNGTWETYVSGTVILSSGANGLYAFRSFDKGGNISAESTIYLDTNAPATKLFAATNEAADGTFTNAGYVKLTATDGLSGVKACYVKLPGGSGFIAYTLDSQLTAQGQYSFYAVDNAGNESAIVAIYLDMTIPSGFVSTNKTEVNGAYTNKSFTYTANDDGSGIGYCQIKRPNGSWEIYIFGTVITNDSMNGLYTFRSFDKAGNMSDEKMVYLDTVSPNAKIFGGGKEIINSSTTNAAYVNFTAADSLSGIDSCFVLIPGAHEYTQYTMGAPLSIQGKYSFYAEDVAGNRSEIVTAYLYNVKPVGFISTDKVESNGAYTNKAFSYTASDNGSGIDYCQIKRPNGVWENYTVGTIITNTDTNGLYTFRCYDKAGNISDESTIYLDTILPTAKLFAGETEVTSGFITNASYVKFAATDMLSGIKTCYVKLPNAGGFTIYTPDTPLTLQGQYSFYSADNAGNESAVVTIYLDKTNPTGSISTDKTETNGAYTNQAFKYTAADGESGIDHCQIKRPNGAWETYVSGTTILSSGVNGLYTFRSFDKGGNVSAESMIYLDTISPNLMLFAGEIEIASGIYSNADYVKLAATDSLSNIKNCYVKLPNAGGFTVYTQNTLLTLQGQYYFYAVDNAGNEAEIITVHLDRVTPAGNISTDKIEVNGAYTNKSFKYTANDDGSGIGYCQIKRPNSSWEIYILDTAITSDSVNGLYIFRSFDRAGNVSDEKIIYLDTVSPNVKIFGGDKELANSSVTNAAYIKFVATDILSGVKTCYVKLPNAGGFTAYSSDTPLTIQGFYSFYAEDAAGNRSEIITVCLDNSGASGIIRAGGMVSSDGSYTNKSFSYTVVNTISGIAYCEIKTPSGAWQHYDEGAEIPSTSTNGWYYFRAVDNASNISVEVKIYLDTVAPQGQLFVNERTLANHSYTNLSMISFAAIDNNLKSCYVKLPDGTDFISYTSYLTFTDIGRYEFYAVDLADNVTETFWIVIDRKTKPVMVNGLTDNIAYGDATVTWSDGNLNTAAPIITVTINGVSYLKGNLIKTIDGGMYRVESTDAAGNTWATTFNSKRIEVLSETLNKIFYESTDDKGNRFTFASYQNAITYATAREAAHVRTAVWNSTTWDGGIPMDSEDSRNAKNGTYYIFKKSSDKNTEVAYFTLERLNAVITEYASESITAYYWWEKTPAQIYTENNLYELTADRIFIGNIAMFGAHANYLIDGKPYSGLNYSTEGNHVLTVYDDYENSYNYIIIIVKTAPDILYKLTGGAWNLATDDKPYALKEAVTLKIEDALSGSFAMYVIKNSMGETLKVVSCGEEYTLSKSGRYIVQAINHGGLSTEITFVLSLINPTVTYSDNAEAKRLQIRITPSTDSMTELFAVTIYKSVDNGLTWVQLEKDDYGRTIGTDNLFYEFNRDGFYRVAVEDNFRSGIDAVIFEKTYKKPAPEGTLHGVTDGGYANGTVWFTWADEATVQLTHDNILSEYKSGTELNVEGEYELMLMDTNGYSRTYTFTIDKTAPQGTLEGVTDGGITNKTVIFEFAKDEAEGALYKSGEPIGVYESGVEITGDGQYKIILTDKAGNISTCTFTIDTVKPVATLSGATSGGKTSGSVTLKNLSKKAEVKAYYNGELYEYALGTDLTKEGNYRFVLTDDAGNISEYTFDIVFSYNAGSVIFIIVFIAILLVGVVLIVLMRKKKLFKSKRK